MTEQRTAASHRGRSTPRPHWADNRLNWAERLQRAMGRPRLTTAARIALKLLGVDIDPACRIGPGLRLAHDGIGVVLHSSTRIGTDVLIHQGVTIGRSDMHVPPEQWAPDGAVVVGDRVLIGANATILFRSGQFVHIGDDAVIGAGSVVTHDVPAGEIWAGNPARRVKPRPESRPS